MRAPDAPPKRWVRGLLDLGAIDHPTDLRFAALSLGELAADVVNGPVGVVHNPAPAPIAHRVTQTERLTGPSTDYSRFAIASRRSGVVGVTATRLLIAPARTAFSHLRRAVVPVPLGCVDGVTGCRCEVKVLLSDGSLSRFSFSSAGTAAHFLSLW